jgi:hypothetical protein
MVRTRVTIAFHVKIKLKLKVNKEEKNLTTHLTFLLNINK